MCNARALLTVVSLWPPHTVTLEAEEDPVLRSHFTLEVTLFWQCVESQMLGDDEADFHLAIISVLYQRINIEMCVQSKSPECCKETLSCMNVIVN